MKSDPLNIVFFPHSANFGLAGTNRLQNIIYFLRKDGVNSLSNIALEDKSKLFGKNPESLFIKNYKEIYYGPSVLDFGKHLFETCWYLLKFRKVKHYNIIYFYGEIDIKNFLFVVWAKMMGYKIIIDIVEDLETYSKYKSFKNKIKYKSAVFFRKRLNYFANGFTVISTSLQQKMRTYFPNSPIFFLPVTVNKYLLSGAEKSNDQPVTVFYSGSFNEKDGLRFLLEALSDVKKDGYKFRFLLSGRGSDDEMKLFWNDVTRFNLQNEVDYKGFLTRVQYIDYLVGDADVFCMTRNNSAYANAGFPFKLGEFLATGKPVIASKVGDVERYLTHDDAFLVSPENPGEIKIALINILKNKLASQSIGSNGRRAAMKHFDHENYAKQLKEFITTSI